MALHLLQAEAEAANLRARIVAGLRRAREQARADWNESRKLLYDFYLGCQIDDLNAVVAHRYGTPKLQTDERIVLNVVAPLIDRLANAYNGDGLRRGYTLAPGALEDAALTDAMQRQHEAWGLDARLLKLDRYTALLKTCFLWAAWDELRGAIDYRVLLPWNVHVVEDADFPGDVERASAVVVELAATTDSPGVVRARHFRYESPEVIAYYEGAQWNAPDERTWREEPNPFGRLTVLAAWDYAPDGEVYLAGNDDLVLAQREINVTFTDAFYAKTYQTHSVPVIKDPDGVEKEQERKLGPKYPLRLVGERSEFFFVTPQPGIDVTLTLVDTYLKRLAQLRGLSPGEFALDRTAPQSGFAKLLDSLPLLEMRQARLPLWRDFERRLFDTERSILAAHGAGVGLVVPPEGATVRTDFGRLSVPVDRADDLAYWKERIALGLATPVDALMALDRLDRAAAEQKWREVLAARRTVMEMGAEVLGGEAGRQTGTAPVGAVEGRTLIVGPDGGRYYLDENGRKVYVEEGAAAPA